MRLKKRSSDQCLLLDIYLLENREKLVRNMTMVTTIIAFSHFTLVYKTLTGWTNQFSAPYH